LEELVVMQLLIGGTHPYLDGLVECHLLIGDVAALAVIFITLLLLK
jgi:hypothetical protein